MKLWSVYRYSVDEGEKLSTSRRFAAGPYDDKGHALWVASVESRNAQAEDEDSPHCFEVEVDDDWAALCLADLEMGIEP